MAAPPPLHTLRISDRPPSGSRARGYLFTAVFLAGCLCINGTQIILAPLWAVNRRLYRAGIGYTKGAFGTLLVLMCQWFAPTKFIVTTEGMDGSVVVKDGKLVGLKLPEKLVIVSNHQVYLDWWYLWAFTYYLNVHSSVLIILKRSLKWLPVVGWGMQFFEFIFLARSWDADRMQLSTHLTSLGKRAQEDQDPLALIIYPEGTLVSKDTRPLSKKFADKQGIDDLTHCLLPRSTGLQFALRTLAPYVPDLHVLDVTVGYPGIPPAGYGQSWYTLRSVFWDRIPPPAVHLHLRLYQVARDVPIGDATKGGAVAPDAEKRVFEEWLLTRWREKDVLLDGFYRHGHFWSGGEKPVGSSAEGGEVEDEKLALEGSDGLEIPVEVTRSWRGYPDAFCWFSPVVVGYAMYKMKWW